VRARIGLVVNPVAGIGGRWALKGSDDPDLVEAALGRGAEPVSPGRAIAALRVLAPAAAELDLLTWADAMGESEAREAGLAPHVLGGRGGATTAADTRTASAALADASVDLLLFAGGDGTAVDVLAAVGGRVPVLGIPAGVKMHSAVFAVNPGSAGRLALLCARGGVRDLADAEVMDLDEDALRAGSVSPRLHGWARVPVEPRLLQGGKARSAESERAAQAAIAGHVIDRVLGDRLCLVGPGTTTRAVMAALGLEKTVLGVDVLRGPELVEADADEHRLLELLEPMPPGGARVIVTPVGGQGFLFGRGNQQLSPRVLDRVGPENVVVVATEAKLAALGGRPLLVDTGDEEMDARLAGFVRAVVGYEREVVYRVSDGRDAG
jgi:predicted polyphosphate/ATP-dependent NAD kinase